MRVRNGNVVEAAEELHVSVQAARRELMACLDVMEARAQTIRQRAEQIKAELQQRRRQKAA